MALILACAEVGVANWLIASITSSFSRVHGIRSSSVAM
jgi:hypothetical protein